MQDLRKYIRARQEAYLILLSWAQILYNTELERTTAMAKKVAIECQILSQLLTIARQKYQVKMKI